MFTIEQVRLKLLERLDELGFIRTSAYGGIGELGGLPAQVSLIGNDLMVNGEIVSSSVRTIHIDSLLTIATLAVLTA